MTPENIAVLVTSISALLGAVAWPMALVVLVVIFRKELRSVAGRVPMIMDRVQSVKIGALEAQLDELARAVPEDANNAGVVTAEQVKVAAKVEVAAREIGQPELLAQMDRLSIEYDTLRRTMAGGSRRTSMMTKIVVQMRGLSSSVSDAIEAYKSSGSPGSRLAAVVMMQMEPKKADLMWLVGRFGRETPFVFYHAALAIQNVANGASASELPKVIDSAREALDILQGFSGKPDENTVHVLQAIIQAG